MVNCLYSKFGNHAYRLWGQHDSSNEHKDVLQNFISLVIAVHWASQRSSCLDHIDVVQSQFDYYLKSLVRLFGKGVLIPNHHLLLHLAECLHAFGLVHRWWSFPLEQYNGIIQRKNTNNKLGLCYLMIHVLRLTAS